MKRLEWILDRAKLLIIVSIVITLLCILFCPPLASEDMLNYAIQFFACSIICALPIPAAKLQNLTGATKFFRQLPFMKYMYFIITVPLLAVAVYGLGMAITIGDPELTFLIVPSVIGICSSSKAVKIAQDALDDPEYV